MAAQYVFVCVVHIVYLLLHTYRFKLMEFSGFPIMQEEACSNHLLEGFIPGLFLENTCSLCS